MYKRQAVYYGERMTAEGIITKLGPRDRLIASARKLFAAEGIRSVGVDRLCAEARVSKRSMYQYFSGKDEVVEATLREEAERHAMGLNQDDDLPPRDRVLAVFQRLDDRADSPEFYGCPFISAATELKDRGHPAFVLAREQKTGLTAHFADLLHQGGARDPELLAQQLTLVFDGASVHAVMHGGATLATRVTVAALLASNGI